MKILPLNNICKNNAVSFGVKEQNEHKKPEENASVPATQNPCVIKPETLQAYSNVKKKSKTPVSQQVIDKLSKRPEKYFLSENDLRYLKDNIALIKDEKVLGVIEESFENIAYNIKNHYEEKVFERIYEATSLIDAVNCAQGHYVYYGRFEGIEGEPSDVTKYNDLNKGSKEEQDSFNYALKKELGENITAKEKRALKSSYYDYNKAEVKDFLNEQKYERLKEYLSSSFNENEEIKNYLYEKYYLEDAKIPESAKKDCRKINKDFNTKLFFSSKSDFKEEAKIIYDELKEWQTASEGKSQNPTVVDISLAKPAYLDGAKGYSHCETISLIPDVKYAKLRFRHEMVHLNQKYHFKLPPELRPLGEEVLLGKKHAAELRNSGVSPEHVMYAHTDVREYIAVAGTGNPEYYSDELKDILIKFGLPEYVFDLKPLPQDEPPKSSAQAFLNILNEE